MSAGIKELERLLGVQLVERDKRHVLASGDVRTALVNGAALGGLAYGTYAFTNYALLGRWTLTLAAADLGWGSS